MTSTRFEAHVFLPRASGGEETSATRTLKTVKPTAYAGAIRSTCRADGANHETDAARAVRLAVFGDGISPATAQTWPERPVTMVVPFPGGGTDLLGRIVAKGLSEVLGQQVVVENVGGAGGMLGSSRVVKSAPDGYTMVIGTTADAINQTLYKAPLQFCDRPGAAGLMGNQPTVLLARKDFPANTLQEFASYVRANPGSVQFGSAGLDRPLVLRTAQRGARHQECNACALSRRRPCDARPDRRSLRLHLHAEPGRASPDRRQFGQRDRHSATQTLAGDPEPAEHWGTGPA